MISTALRTDIEIWAAKTDERPLFRLASEGRLTAAMVTRYIANVTYLVKLTPANLTQAREGALALGDERLAAHYQLKIDEEEGHAIWGESDLDALGKLAKDASTRPTPSVATLIQFLRRMTSDDPSLYLTYLAFTEYITVLLGPLLLSRIEEHCGVPRTAMTIIDNHIEIDRDHAEEGFGIIDDLVPDPRKIGPMRDALARICDHFDRFCYEVVVAEDEHERERHVSAA